MLFHVSISKLFSVNSHPVIGHCIHLPETCLHIRYPPLASLLTRVLVPCIILFVPSWGSCVTTTSACWARMRVNRACRPLQPTGKCFTPNARRSFIYRGDPLWSLLRLHTVISTGYCLTLCIACVTGLTKESLFLFFLPLFCDPRRLVAKTDADLLSI